MPVTLPTLSAPILGTHLVKDGPSHLNYDFAQLSAAGTEARAGLVQFATSAEVSAKVITDKAVVPAYLDVAFAHNLISNIHTDINSTLPAAGQVLAWDSDTNKWVATNLDASLQGAGNFLESNFIAITATNNHSDSLTGYCHAEGAAPEAWKTVAPGFEWIGAIDTTLIATFQYQLSGLSGQSISVYSSDVDYNYELVKGVYVECQSWFNDDEDDYAQLEAKFPDGSWKPVYHLGGYPRSSVSYNGSAITTLSGTLEFTSGSADFSNITTVPAATTDMSGTIDSLSGSIVSKTLSLPTLNVSTTSDAAKNFSIKQLFVPINTGQTLLELRATVRSSTETVKADIDADTVDRNAVALKFKIVGVEQLNAVYLSPDVEIIHCVGSNTTNTSGYFDSTSTSNSGTAHACPIWSSLNPGQTYTNWGDSGVLPISRPSRCKYTEIEMESWCSNITNINSEDFILFKCNINWNTGSVNGFYTGQGGNSVNDQITYVLSGNISQNEIIFTKIGGNWSGQSFSAEPRIKFSGDSITALPYVVQPSSGHRWNEHKLTVKHYKTIPSSEVDLTTNSWSLSSNLSENGYQVFSNGLIMQWGYTDHPLGNTVKSFTFPIAFPNQLLNASVTQGGAVGVFYTYNVDYSLSNNTHLFVNSQSGGSVFYWKAIGF